MKSIIDKHTSGDSNKWNKRNIALALLISLSIWMTSEINWQSIDSKSSQTIAHIDKKYIEHFEDPIQWLQKNMTDYPYIIENNIIDQINKIRAENNLQPLIIDEKLTKAAQIHAEDMSKKSYFSHKSKSGQSPQDRSQKQWFKWLVVENIGKNYYSIQDAMTKWTNSKVHYDNMNKPSNTHVGVWFSDWYRVIVLGAQQQ